MRLRLQPGSIMHRTALALIGLALMARLLVPAGFMPDTGRGFAITICSGNMSAPAWIDSQGKVHKGEQRQDHGTDHPCAFAGFAAALDAPSIASAMLAKATSAIASPAFPLAVAIGRGLAAPPPPATGPPTLH